MNKGIIFTGGSIDLEFAAAWLAQSYRIREGKLTDPAGERVGLIAADRGLAACVSCGLVPDLIVGDFDSADPGLLDAWMGRTDTKICTYKPEKDWTDTELALEHGMELGWKQAAILGATGTRADHFFGSLQTLALALAKGISCELLDPYNRIRMTDRPLTLSAKTQWGTYVSLFAYGGNVTGLTLKGFRYTVEDFLLTGTGTRGVSNEIVSDRAEISFRSGTLLVMETSDMDFLTRRKG